MNTTSFIESTLLLKTFTTMTDESWFIPFDILMIVSTIVVILLSIMFLLIIILDKTCHTISIMLTANSCLSTLVIGCSLLSLCVFTLQNDLKPVEYQNSHCIIQGYLSHASPALGSYSFLVQTLYRYVSVIYPARLFFQTVRFQLLIICLTWIVSFIYPLAFVFTGDIVYNIDNQICQLAMQPSFAMIFIVTIVYLTPISMIMMIYLKLVHYVHQMSKRITPANTFVRAKRELKMTKRIIIVIHILMTIGIPYALFIIMSFFTHPPKYHYRIAFIFVDISLIVVMIILFQFTDPLKTAIMKRIKRRPNRIVAII